MDGKEQARLSREYAARISSLIGKKLYKEAMELQEEAFRVLAEGFGNKKTEPRKDKI